MNSYNVNRVSKFDDSIEVIKGSVHGWQSWDEFCAKTIARYGAELIDGDLHTDNFVFKDNYEA